MNISNKYIEVLNNRHCQAETFRQKKSRNCGTYFFEPTTLSVQVVSWGLEHQEYFLNSLV